MLRHQIVGLQLTPENAVLLALGAGLGAALLVFLFCRFVLGWGSRDPWAEGSSQRVRLSAREEAAEQGDPFVHGGKMDRRQAMRRGGNPVAVLITDADASVEPIHGYVLDRSTGGLCLSLGEPVEEGAVLSVKTANAPKTTPWIRIEVRNCRPISAKEWELGCKFEKTPPWSILLLFG